MTGLLNANLCKNEPSRIEQCHIICQKNNNNNIDRSKGWSTIIIIFTYDNSYHKFLIRSPFPLQYHHHFKMKQLDVDMSPPTNIMTFRLGLTHLTFDLDPCDLTTG